ncbi:MAG TPA: hypothetical protein VHO90_02115, partial [Bacteroidales bacterium]|nr:hypothetical protein [Bacteroidales bacterium]
MGYLSVRGNIWWKPNRWLTFTAGNDKHFIGDGYQSLMLSENADAYPFFQTKLNIWKIQYQHQVMFMHDLVYGAGDKRFPKYSSQHVISYNITPKLNVYIFEAVIWRSQDTLRHRRFDFTYLNPFIFFRPVEFNQGSADNVLIGVGGKYNAWGRNYFYGQFLLDEFKFNEYIKQSGWWASKYALQIGFKTYGLFKNSKSLFLVEYNQCRPYTYAHLFPLQNYGYLYQPLAHPQGSNFREIVSSLKFQYNRLWLIKLTGHYLDFGQDNPQRNQGSDIYKSQLKVDSMYGNWIGQGIKNKLLSGELYIARMLAPSWRLVAFSTLNLTLHEEANKRN